MDALSNASPFSFKTVPVMIPFCAHSELLQQRMNRIRDNRISQRYFISTMLHIEPSKKASPDGAFAKGLIKHAALLLSSCR